MTGGEDGDTEPTLTERLRAAEAVERATRGDAIHAGALADAVAVFLAEQRAKLTARYEEVADELEQYAAAEREAHNRAVAGQYMYDVFLHRGRAYTADLAAARVRQVGA